MTLTSLLEIGLDLTYESSDFAALTALMNEKQIPCHWCSPEQAGAGKVLVVSCITGMGTAEKFIKCYQKVLVS